MGTIGIPMLAEERENLLLKLSQQTKHLVAQKRTNYKLVIGIVFNEKIRPKIQVWFDAHHRIYKGEGRIKTLFRFGKAKARTPEEYASWLLESLDQHIEVIEGELHPENFEITTPPLSTSLTCFLNSIKASFKKVFKLFLNLSKALRIAELGQSLINAKNKKLKKPKKRKKRKKRKKKTRKKKGLRPKLKDTLILMLFQMLFILLILMLFLKLFLMLPLLLLHG
ncbi:predicted protein [Lodderomyces elongisporus NRRL YB-4239]|uniref:Uncharacterized protein n=1 Tax=Lodderomyces elongisporus (strain ATCC 11503 / CBS 2605 / JCM 1781 / NBRC 1676 / NRRL YB-4239) TaxID=379508 RepID=A5E2V4_LODEL|nr:predicted protein [Lodderomyces elongisporus NRRL YB-4239]